MEIFLLKFVTAAVFSSLCAFAYLRLARNRKDVRRESLLVLGTLMVFSVLRLATV